jgi:hypothetical protein
VSFHFEKLKDPPTRLGASQAYEVYWEREPIGFVWEIQGVWYADRTMTFFIGHKPTVRGQYRSEVANALRDGLRGV